MSELGHKPDYLTLLDDDNEFDDEFQVQHHVEGEPQHTLPLNVLDQQEHSQVHQLIHSSYRREASLARDVAYLGSIDLEFVTSNHGITREELKEKLANPTFQKLVEKFQNEIGEDSAGMLRVRSNAYLDTGISRLYEIIMNRDTKDENVIKAMTLLASLGGAMPKAGIGADGTGIKIEFNFGSDNPMMRARTIIEGDSE